MIIQRGKREGLDVADQQVREVLADQGDIAGRLLHGVVVGLLEHEFRAGQRLVHGDGVEFGPQALEMLPHRAFDVEAFFAGRAPGLDGPDLQGELRFHC